MAAGAEGGRVGDDVVVAECNPRRASVSQDLLEAHHVVGVVAQDDMGERQAQAGSRLEFLRGEQKSAVAGYGDHRGAGAHQAGGHRPGQGDAQGLLAVGEQQPPGLVDPEVASHVDVDRADVAGDCGLVVVAEFLAQPQHDRGRVEAGALGGVIARGGIDVAQRLSLPGDLAPVAVGEREVGQLVAQRPESGRDVADQLAGGLIVVVDVGGHRVDVHDGACDVAVPQHGVVFDSVVPDGDQHVGLAQDDVAGLVAEQAHPAQEVVLEGARHHPGGLEGLHHGQPRRGDQGAQRQAAVRVGAAAADEQRRAACAADEFACPLDGERRSRRQRRDRQAGGDAGGGRGGQHVGGQHDGGGPARRAERCAERRDGGLGGVVGVVDLAGELRDRLEQRCGVHGLMRAFEAVFPAHGPAQRDHRVLLGVGGEQPGGQVGGAGTRRHQDDARHPGEAADRRGHERRVLLVAAHHQPRAGVGQGVVDGVDLGAGHAEDVLDALRREHLNDLVRAAHRFGGLVEHHVVSLAPGPR